MSHEKDLREKLFSAEPVDPDAGSDSRRCSLRSWSLGSHAATDCTTS